LKRRQEFLRGSTEKEDFTPNERKNSAADKPPKELAEEIMPHLHPPIGLSSSRADRSPRRDTPIHVSWSLGINFRWAGDWGAGSTYGGQAAIFYESRARVVIWPPPSTNPNLRSIDIAAVSRIAHL
jgi:hypothetical protein